MPKILIIGGGIAGLKAALDLSQKGYTVTLLEARSRLGGRIYTINTSDDSTPIELGASFWEGQSDNPFYQQYFTPNKPTDLYPSTQLFSLHDSRFFSLYPEAPGATVQDVKLLAEAYQQAQPYLQQLPSIGIGKTCEALLQEHFSLPLSPLAYWEKKWMEHDLRHSCTPLNKRGFGSFWIPPHNALEAWNEDEAAFCFVSGGYTKVINQIAQACLTQEVTILYNQAVTHVEDHFSQGVKVKTNNDTFYADKVISTIPVGVLKTQAASIFNTLSLEKQQAIQALGIHEAVRVVLAFEQPFWENLQGPYLFFETPTQPGFKEFRNNFPLHGKAILQTDSYTDVAQILLAKKKDQKAPQGLIHHIMRDLRKAYPDAPDPHFYFIHSWTQDPFAQGAYPYRTIEMTEQMQQALERPEGNIYFAGADISRYGFSVHNAYASAEKTAAEIAQLK